MRLFALVVIAGVTSTTGAQQISSCSPVDDSKQTRWGHQHAVIDGQNRPVKTIAGIAQDPLAQPVENVLVEIFPYREGDPAPHQSDEPEKPGRRIVACLTDITGRFGFDLPSGRYEIRLSGRDWNSTSALVVVNSKKGKRTKLKLPLMPGT